jgi:hypothetical protein
LISTLIDAKIHPLAAARFAALVYIAILPVALAA